MKLRLTRFPFFKGYLSNSRKLPDFSHHKKNKLNYLKSNSSMQMMNVNKCLKKASLFLSLKKKKRIFGCHTRVVYIYIGMWQLSILCVTWGGLIALFSILIYMCVCARARVLTFLFHDANYYGTSWPTMWCEVHVPRCHLEEEKKFEEVKSFHNEFKSSFLKLG